MPHRSLGVDYGLVRTGIAVTSGGYSPRPISILSSSSSPSSPSSSPDHRRANATVELSKSIVNLMISEMATEIVLGLPLHRDGTDSEQSELTRDFGRVLAMEVRRRRGRECRVVLYDERYTSREARSRMIAEAMARNDRIPTVHELRGCIDAYAACLILEQYYRDDGWANAEVLSLMDDSIEAISCDIEYAKYAEGAERERSRMMHERYKRVNARREMIDRDRASEGGMAMGDCRGGTRRRKKKKKKK
ncbi:hypothetical protein ACHAXA_005018 [Cyclostephanos tholiformis]|uniref:YqgF/RNase H-like domain-containing protein n=1 Tax=Cyclostephanos tholiformis TaxID=382380 RepID=A0ABD3RYU2_9STRA